MTVPKLTSGQQVHREVLEQAKVCEEGLNKIQRVMLNIAQTQMDCAELARENKTLLNSVNDDLAVICRQLQQLRDETQ